MRSAAAALAAVLALVLAGCGSSNQTQVHGADGQDAAALVPPGALLFLTADTHIDSKQWQVVEDATGGLTLLQGSLHRRGLDFERDVRPALGDEVDVAVLVDEGKPDAVVLTQSKDETKLRTLAAKFDHGTEHYTVERIGDWSVVADSQSAFDAVRAARSGRSLADVATFKNAMSAVHGDAVAKAYVDGAGLQQVPGGLGALVRAAGSPRWVAARLSGGTDAVSLDVRIESPTPAPVAYRPTLLRDVPSGAILALSFKDVDRTLGRLAADPALRRMIERYVGVPLEQLTPALRGEGAFYVLPGAALPLFALEVDSPTPEAASRSLRLVAAGLRRRTGSALPVRVARYGSRVVFTDAPTKVTTPAGSLVGDQPFKDALAAADVPGEVTFLAYADVPRLAPLIQALAPVLGAQPPSATTLQRLDRLGSLVAFGARAGSIERVELRVTIR
jgi:hypothetical protein